jgi:hypothetical protein
MALHEATGERHWLEVALEIEEGLARKDYGVPFQSHWCLYALELLQSHFAVPLHDRHAKMIACHILEHPDYRATRRSTPVACRSEGLLAFLRMKRAAGDGSDRALIAECLSVVRDNLALQLAHRYDDGSFKRGGADQRDTEVRIDYIQHNISAFLYYYEYVNAEAQSAVLAGTR